MDLWLLQDHISSFDNLVTRGESTLDGYDVIADNQNLYAAYEWHFHFRNLTVELYRVMKKSAAMFEGITNRLMHASSTQIVICCIVTSTTTTELYVLKMEYRMKKKTEISLLNIMQVTSSPLRHVL